MAGRSWTKSLAALVAAALVPAILSAAVTGWMLVERQRDLLETEFRQLAGGLMNAAERELANQMQMVGNLAQTTELDSDGLSSFYLHAQRLAQTNPAWIAIQLHAPDGTPLLNTLRPTGADLPRPINLSFLLEAAQAGRPILAPVQQPDNVAPHPYLVIAAPVLREGRLRYLLSVALRPSNLSALVRGAGPSRDRLASVHDRDFVIAARSRGEHLIGQKASDSMVIEARRSEGRLFTNRTREGEEYLGIATQSPTTGWWVAIGTSATELYTPLRKSMSLVVLCGLIAAAISVGLATIKGREIRDLALAEERMKSAELRDAQRALQTSHDEACSAQAAAERANAAKSRFLAAASHDLRQPFQALRLYHLVLEQMHTQLPPTAAQAVDALGQAVTAGEELLTALLDVSALEAGTIRPRIEIFSVAAVLEELAAEYAPEAARRGLRLKLFTLDAHIVSDRVLLKRILRNLIHNAFRYTPAGGVLLGCRRRGAEIDIEVWDTGEGIPADALESVFEDFYQLNNPSRDRSRGLGLGLSIVQRTAQLLGHRIALASRVDRGSVFRVRVAVAEPTPAAPTPERTLQLA